MMWASVATAALNNERVGQPFYLSVFQRQAAETCTVVGDKVKFCSALVSINTRALVGARSVGSAQSWNPIATAPADVEFRVMRSR